MAASASCAGRESRRRSHATATASPMYTSARSAYATGNPRACVTASVVRITCQAIHGCRLYEVAKYVTMAPFYASYFSVCANRQKIQSLPKDVRDQIMSVSALPGSKFWGKNFFDSAEAGVLERAKAANIELDRKILADLAVNDTGAFTQLAALATAK